MSERSSRGGGRGASADILDRAQIRREADERFLAAVRVGDAETFGRLFDSWVDVVNDRVVRSGVDAAAVPAIESSVFRSAWGDLSRGGGASTFGAEVAKLTLRETQPRRSPVAVPEGAEERLTRGTRLATTAEDPGVAALLFEAAEALGQKAREVLDLHFRHGFTAGEIADVVGGSAEEVEGLIRKLPAAFDAVVRARVLWNGGSPPSPALASALGDAGTTSFGPDAVRTSSRARKDDDKRRARSMIPIGALACSSSSSYSGSCTLASIAAKRRNSATRRSSSVLSGATCSATGSSSTSSATGRGSDGFSASAKASISSGTSSAS